MSSLLGCPAGTWDQWIDISPPSPICARVKSRVLLGMGNLPPLMTESLFHGYLNPYYWVDDHPYHRKTRGV